MNVWVCSLPFPDSCYTLDYIGVAAIGEKKKPTIKTLRHGRLSISVPTISHYIVEEVGVFIIGKKETGDMDFN